MLLADSCIFGKEKTGKCNQERQQCNDDDEQQRQQNAGHKTSAMSFTTMLIIL